MDTFISYVLSFDLAWRFREMTVAYVKQRTLHLNLYLITRILCSLFHCPVAPAFSHIKRQILPQGQSPCESWLATFLTSLPLLPDTFPLPRPKTRLSALARQHGLLVEM